MARLASRRASEPRWYKHLVCTILAAICLLPGVTPGTPPGSGSRGIQPKCVSYCKESSKYGLQPGTTYQYKYETELRTFATDASSQESQIHVTATAVITAITACEQQLQLKDVRFTESHPTDRRASPIEIPNAAQLVREVTEQPLRFSFQDGKIEHLCAPEGEYKWALNIKRGVLSLLQNTMDDLNKAQALHENDVNGKCLTRYEVTDATQSRIIKRIKNMKSCSQRQSHISAIQSVPYSSSSPVQNIPLLTGSQECTQTIQNRQLTKVTCLEEHKFQPFDKTSSGVTTVVSQSLTYESMRTTPTLKQDWREFKKSSLIFEAQGDDDAGDGNMQEILNLLQGLERESVPKVNTRVPEKFIDLVAQLRTVNYAAILTLFSKASSDVSRTFILDALPLVGTAPSLTFMREMFTQGKLSENQIDSWLTSITFIKNPSLEMIPAISPMLDGVPRNQALLSIASVINAYCRNHDTCAQETPVQDTLRKILSFLGTSCKLSKYGSRDLTRAIFALKAIGNAGRLPTDTDDRSFQLLRKCFEDSTNPIDTRLAALDAFRRMPCTHYDQSPMTQLYKNMQEQTEVRIGGYLISMRCPSRELIEAVKDTLYIDPVNQVGSFVWTHLTNLQETSSPDKQALKDLLSNDFLKNKFNTDARKFSRNYESSMFWEEANVGGGVDANVIFTPDSFLPRQSNLNLTLHLFGESINILEFGGRVHSFEQLLESVFGPEGYFPEPHINDALNTVRSKRDTSTNQVERLGQVFNQAGLSRSRLPGGSVYMRVFGNEISYKHFEFSHKQTAPSLVDENGKNWLDITYLFDNLGTGKSTAFTKSSILMDSQYVVPTGAGIPLSLGIQAAATIGIKASGKIDLGNFWEEQEVDVHGAFEPSGAVEVDGQLTLQIGRSNSKLRSGIKFQNTLHTATAIQARVLVKGTDVVHASLTLPQPKQEILEVKSQLILMSPSGLNQIVGEVEAHQPAPVQMCSPDILSTLIGLKFCASASVPDKMTFPPLKPTAMSIWIEKTDTFNSYEFDYKWIQDENRDKQDVSLLFNTPGSQVDRRVALTYSLDMLQGKLEGSIETPRKSLLAQGHYSKTAQNLQFVLKSKDEQILMVSMGLRRQLTRMEPHFLVSYYSRPIVDVQGVMYLANVLEKDGKANFDLSVKHLTETPVQFTGELIRLQDTYNARVGITSSLVTGNIRSQIKVKPGLVTSKAEIQYSWRGQQNVLNLGGKVQIFEKGALVKYSVGAILTSPQLSYLNTDFSWEIAMARGYFENNVKLLLGKSFWEAKGLYKNQLRRQLEDVQLLLALTAPQNEIDYYVDFQHQKNQSGIFTQFIGRVDAQKEVRAQAEYLRRNEKLLKRNLNAEISWPATTHSIKSGVTEVRPGEYEAELVILPNGKKQKKATASYKDGSTKRRQDHDLVIRAENFLKTPVIFTGKMTASERESFMMTQLQVEGRGQWGGSFEYSASKRFAHRMEGKVDLNGIKYSGELNWRQAKSGDQRYTADFQLHQNFYAELLVRDDTAYSGKLTIIPNKSFHPEDRIVVEGKLGSESGKVQIDYFGKSVILAGVYSRLKVQLEAEMDSKRLAFSIETPHFTVQRFAMKVNVETPVVGYNTLGLTVDHTYNGNTLNSRVQGYVEAKTTAVALYGNLDMPQSTFSVMFESSGMDKLVAVVKMSEAGPAVKLLEVTLQKGTQETTLKAELANVPRMYNFKVDFSGCSFIPQILLEYNHQKTSEVTDTFAVRWTPLASSTPRTIEGRVTYLLNPFKTTFLVTTPWKSFDKVEGRFSIFQSDLNQEVKIYMHAPSAFFPINFELKRGGTLDHFAHSVGLTWYVGKSQKAMQITSSGRLGSIDNGELEVDLKVPDHRYHFGLSSKRSPEAGLQVESNVDYDGQRIEIGFVFDYQSLSNIKTLSWVQIPTRPKIHVSFEHLAQPGSYMLDFSAGLVDQKMNTVKLDFKGVGWRKWDLSAKMASPLNFLPDVDLSSNHDFTQIETLHHQTEYNIRKMSELWGGSAEKKGVFVFNIDQGKLDSSFSMDTDYFHLVGEVDLKKFFFKAKATTDLLPDYDVTFGAEIHVLGAADAEVYAEININGTQIHQWSFHLDANTAKIHIDCPLGHVFEAEGKFDWPTGLFEFDLKETKKDLLKVRTIIQLNRSQGKLEFELDGNGYKVLAKKAVIAKYSLTTGKIDFDATYEDSSGRNGIVGLAEFTAERKLIDFKVTGGHEFALVLHDNKRLEGVGMLKGQKIFAITAEYDFETDEFALGKHILKVAYATDKTYSAQAIIGLDPSKILVQVNTPFESWKQFLVTGEWKVEGSQNSGEVTIRKGESLYRVKVGSQLTPREGTLGLEMSTPWSGYQRLVYKANYLWNRDQFQGRVIGTIDSSSVILSLTYDPNKAELDLSTPFVSLSKLVVSTQWNLKGPLNTVELKTVYNRNSHMGKIQWDVTPSNGSGQLTYRTGTSGDSGKVLFKYDWRQGYNAEASVAFPGWTTANSKEIAGKMTLQPGQVQMDIQTPLGYLQSFSAKATFLQPTPGTYKSALDWTRNGQQNQVSSEIRLVDQTLEVEFRSPLPSPWNVINGQFGYAPTTTPPGGVVTIQLKRGGKEDFSLRTTFLSKVNEKSLTLDLRSTLAGWEHLESNLLYNRAGLNHQLSFDFAKSLNILRSDISLTLPKSPGQEMSLTSTLALPQVKFDIALDLKMKIDFAGETSIKTKLTQNGVEYSGEGSFQMTSTAFKVQAQSSFSPMRNFVAAGSFRQLSDTALSVQLNEKVIDLKLQGSYDGLNQFKINCDLTTPFEGYRMLHGEAQLTLRQPRSSGSFKFQNERVRYLGKMEGRLDSDSGEIRLQFNSPLYRLENVVWSLKFGDSKAMLQLERNTLEDLKIEVSIKNSQLVLGLISSLPGYPINTRALVDWSSSPVSAQLLLDSGTSNSDWINVKAKIQGFKIGSIDIRTLAKGWETVNFEWSLEGTGAQGKAKLTYDLPLYGQRSFRSSWKHDQYKSLEAEFWWNENTAPERGLSVQYSYVSPASGLGKFSGSVSYIGEKNPQALKLSVSVKTEEGGASLIDFSLKTPFSSLKDLNLAGKIVTGREIALDVTTTLNRQPALTLASTLVVDPLESRLRVNFNAPAIAEPFNLNVMYNLRTTDKHVDLFFAQNKYKLNVKTQAIVSKENPQEIELRMNVDSNIPSVTVSASASLRAGYKIESDGTRQVTVAIDSLQTGNWRAVAALRPRADFKVTARLESPNPDVVPSLKAEFGWDRTPQGLTGSLSYQMATHDIHARLTLTSNVFKMTLTSGYAGLENVLLQGTLESGEGTVNKKVGIDIRLAGETITLTTNMVIPTKGRSFESSIRLVSSWGMIPSASLEARMDEAGVLTLHGNWGQRNVDLRGEIMVKRGLTLRQAAEATLTLSLDSVDIVTLQSHHLFQANQYSWNVTLGNDFGLLTFLEQTGDRSVFSGEIKWVGAGNSLRIRGETNKGKLKASFDSPWASEIEVSCQYKIEDEEFSADGFLTYAGVKSGLRAELLTKEEAISARMNVDVPVLGQKLDAKIHLQMAEKDKLVGIVEMSMGDRRLSLKGSLTTSQYSSQLGRMLEQVLKISISLPRSDYIEVSTDWTLRRPENGWHHAELSGSLTLPKGNHKGAFRYDLPIGTHGQLGAQWFLDCELVFPDIVKGSVEIQKYNLDEFSGGLKYKENELKVSWDLKKTFVLDVTAHIPSLFQESSPLRFEAEGVFAPGEKLRLRSTFSVNKDSSTVELSLIQSPDGTNTHVLINIPTLVTDQLEFVFKVRDIGNGRTVLDLLGSYGQESFGALGEFISTNATISVSFKVSGSFGSHFVHLAGVEKSNGHFFELNAESQNLFRGKKIIVTGNIIATEKGYTAVVECQTKQAAHVISLAVEFEPGSGNLLVKFDSPIAQPIRFDSSYVINSDQMGLKVLTNMMDTHEFEVSFDRREREVRLRLNCPFIHPDPVSAHGRAKTGESQMSFIGDLDMFGNRFRGEGTLKFEQYRDMELRIEVITPFKALDRISLTGKLSEDEVEVEFMTPIDDLPDFMIKSSGIRFFESNDWSNFHPKLTISLPFVKYSAGASFQIPSNTFEGKFGGHFEQEHPNEDREHYDLYLTLTPFERLRISITDPVQIKFTASSPLEGFHHLELLLGGNVVWQKWGDFIAEGQFNDHKVSVVSQLLTDGGNQELNVNFRSPFKGYEKFGVVVQIQAYEEIGAGHNIHLEFQQPGWTKPLALEIDYRIRYNGLGDMDGEFKIVPEWFPASPFLVQLRSNVKDTTYTGLLEGSFGTSRPILKITGVLTSDVFSGSVEGKMGENSEYQFMTKIETVLNPQRFSVATDLMLNYNQVVLFSVGHYRDDNVIEGEVRVKTPFAAIRSATAIYRLSPLKKMNLTLSSLLTQLDLAVGLSHNDRKVIHLELVNVKGKRILEVHNPFHPVSLAVGYDLSSASKYVMTELCWDLTKNTENTYGFNFGWKPRGLTMKVHAGRNGFVNVDIANLRTAKNIEQRFSLTWNQPFSHGEGEAGYQLSWTDQSKLSAKAEDFRLRIDFPWRSIQLDRKVGWSVKEGTESLQISWDIKRDPTKVMGYKLLTGRSTAWRSSSTKQTLILSHSILAHDLTFILDRRYANRAWQGYAFVFQPNPFPENTLTLDLKRDSVRNKEVRFQLTHPATHTDTTVHYKSADTTQTLYLAHVDITGEKQVFNFEMTSDGHGTFVDASTADGPWLKLEYKSSLNQPRLYLKTRSFELSGDYVNFPPLLKGGVKYGAGKELTFLAGLPHMKEITVKVARDNFGMNIRDVMVSLKLNASQVLSTQVHWRPQLGDELSSAVIDSIPKLANQLLWEVVPNALAIVNDEIEERLAIINPSLSQAYSELKRISRIEIDVVLQEIGRVVNYVRNLHAKNILYTQDVLEILKACVAKVYDTWSDSIDGMRKWIVKVWSGIQSRIDDVMRIWIENGARLETALMSIWSKVETKINTLGNDLGRMLIKMIESYDTIGHILNGNLAEIQNTLKNLGIIRKLSKIYKDYCDWLRELPVHEYLDEAYEMFKDLVLRPFELLYQPYLNAWNSALEHGDINTLLELPPFPYIRFVTNRLVAVTNRFWIFVEAEQKIKSLVRNILSRVDIIIQSHLPIASMVWDINKGHIEYHQPLSIIEWNHFNEWPQFKASERDFEQTSEIQKIYQELLDTMRNTQPLMELDVRDLLPPFDSTAVIAGDHHFLTFDGSYYRFSGDCSYILMTDLLQQNLTVLVNYGVSQPGQERKKMSYSLLTGKSTVEIETNTLAVKINGIQTELPVTIGSTFIRRQRSGLEVLDKRGFQMKCSQSNSVCRLSVSGWYFGKIGGLLGNYDNEKNNDLRTPDGSVVTDVANFAHSWRVGGKSGECQLKNYDNKSGAEMEDSLCHQMLNMTSSPLRPCFNTVNVDLYKRMCQYDMKNGKGERDGRICTAVAAYVMQCQQQGVDIWMPPQCVKCKLDKGTPMRSGENTTYNTAQNRPPPKSADIVFLIEEAASLRSYDMTDTVKKLEAALKVEGIDNNRYAIIGFGGKGGRAKPHIRTSSSEVWTPVNSFKIADMAIMDGDGKGDLYEAIEFAATIGYRAGVSKTMVAIVANRDQCQDNVRYSDSLTLLIENDIRLHILTPEEFALKVETKENEASRILGVDLDGAYTVRQSVKRGPIESDKALRRQVKMPKDLCTPLAMETTGTLFNLKMIQRPAFAKQFVDVWTRRVASTSKPSDCQLCECLPDRDGGSITLCHQCVSPNLQKFMDDLNHFDQNPDETSLSWIEGEGNVNESTDQ